MPCGGEAHSSPSFGAAWAVGIGAVAGGVGSRVGDAARRTGLNRGLVGVGMGTADIGVQAGAYQSRCLTHRKPVRQPSHGGLGRHCGFRWKQHEGRSSVTEVHNDENQAQDHFQ